MNLFTPLWLLWGAVFAVIEGTALWSRRKGVKGNGTLSALVWRFTAHTWGRILFAAGWIVLTVHLFFQIP